MRALTISSLPSGPISNTVGIGRLFGKLKYVCVPSSNTITGRMSSESLPVATE